MTMALSNGSASEVADFSSDFEDEFLGVPPDLLAGSSVSTETLEAIESPMFSETAGDDWPIGEGPTPDPVDRVSVTDPTIGSSSPTVAKLVDHFAKIRELETAIADTCSEEANLKEKAKGLRKRRERLVESLQAIKGGNENIGDDEANQDCDDDDQDVVEIGGEAVASPCSPQAWGTDGVEALESCGLTSAKVEALRAASDAGHFNGTIKGLRDWIAKYDLWHRDVKGCGPTGADKIVDALTSYIAQNPVADEPLTAEDEARHVAAAEWLGHLKSDGVALDCGGDSVTSVESTAPTNETEAEDRASTPQVKPRKSRAKKMSPPIGLTSKMESDSNEGNQITEDASPDAKTEETDLADCYASGLKAGAAGSSCSENPFPDRSSAPAKEWQRGWDIGAEPKS